MRLQQGTERVRAWLKERESLAVQRDRLRERAWINLRRAVERWCEERAAIDPISGRPIFDCRFEERSTERQSMTGLLLSCVVETWNGARLEIVFPDEGAIFVNGVRCDDFQGSDAESIAFKEVTGSKTRRDLWLGALLDALQNAATAGSP